MNKVLIQHGIDFKRYIEVVRNDPSFVKVIAGIIHSYGQEAIQVIYSMPFEYGLEIHSKIDSIIEWEKDFPPEYITPRHSVVNGSKMVKEIYDFLIENNPVDHATLADNSAETPKIVVDKSLKLGQSTSHCSADIGIPSSILLNTTGNHDDQDLSSITGGGGVLLL